MKNVCFYFKIHQPYRLKRYRFFDIGNDHYYYDDFADDEIISRLAEVSYLPMCDTLLEMIKESNGSFKCSISVSGTALEQLQQYVPECIDKLRALAQTGCVEFLSTTFSHSLASLEDPEEFIREVKLENDLITNTLGIKPKTFANTELIYDDDIAMLISSMGFKSCLTAGAKHVLGWKSPNYVYKAATAPSLKLLLTNDKLSDDIARNFNNPAWPEYPLNADTYMDWIAALPEEEQVVNLYFSMDTFGSFLPANTGIFQFMRALPRFAAERNIVFTTPSEVTAKMKAVGELSVPYPISDIDEARDVSAWKGNDLQREALSKLYGVAERVSLCTDRRLKQDWEYLQSSDHFYYMSTKNMADGASHAAFSPYDSPFAAFTNYMNVLADFLVRVEEQYPESIDNEELNSLLLTIRNQASEISALNKEVSTLRANNIEELTVVEEKPAKKSVKAPAKGKTVKAEKSTKATKEPKAAKKKVAK
ncbi:MAG: polysaccharide deacetylase family protein [Bacteroidales bacterium]|nr:polysaccharide deacetylase family protein [Bacteroidales bacterium]MBD5222823.1 polysaccharide deacetylase family protein [Bacteroidales bacterium]MBD5302213.1 polysaccharide deacetylase family protein [Bacteroides sp.]